MKTGKKVAQNASVIGTPAKKVTAKGNSDKQPSGKMSPQKTHAKTQPKPHAKPKASPKTSSKTSSKKPKLDQTQAGVQAGVNLKDYLKELMNDELPKDVATYHDVIKMFLVRVVAFFGGIALAIAFAVLFSWILDIQLF